METVIHLTLKRTEYVLKAEIAAQESGATVFTNEWTYRIARRFI